MSLELSRGIKRLSLMIVYNIHVIFKNKNNSYSNTAINKFNSYFYSSLDDVYKESGLADFFTKIEPIQTALAKKIEKLINKQEISIIELGTGKDISRWQIISGHAIKKWVVKLTDFTDNSLPMIDEVSQRKNFDFSTKKIDLLKPFITAREKNKVDVILATYVFDSIWFQKDLHLEKKNGKWYQAKYKLTGSFTKKMSISDFQKIEIEKRLEEVDIGKFEYGEIIAKYYSNKKTISLNFPGGLINKVVEAFDKQIAPGGAFINGDMAVNDKKGFIQKDTPSGKDFYMEDYFTSGKAAKFKLEDYGLAREVLETKGFKVELETVEDFVKDSGYQIPLAVKDHWIMVVKKN